MFRRPKMDPAVQAEFIETLRTFREAVRQLSLAATIFLASPRGSSTENPFASVLGALTRGTVDRKPSPPTQD